MSKMLRILLACVLFLMWATSAHAVDTIHAFGPDSLKQIMASHTGKPYVIVVWGLDCAYCQASFAALAEAQRARKFTVVTIATDPADDPQARRLIMKKLQASGLASQIWAFGDAPVEQLRYAIDPKWFGELPRTYWINAQGEKRAHSGALSKAVIDKLSSHW
ncbi:thiol-disulfide isomerase/thioredoxin [Paucimonas lemoignei]|uniref:Thiol-disulfide isomerase/thioredoxin n=1 Tax=Paucimonas lemoignei TaxID=29443 RepID=A0A4R3HU53_PAULE|nr:hypothetical protein [Paucimonas lemoignei]TCS36013.1 thiol-disulfide isomerase/thioredoxin [Paucimonas lemoignei]